MEMGLQIQTGCVYHPPVAGHQISLMRDDRLFAWLFREAPAPKASDWGLLVVAWPLAPICLHSFAEEIEEIPVG